MKRQGTSSEVGFYLSTSKLQALNRIKGAGAGGKDQSSKMLIVTIQKERRNTETAVPMNYSEAELEEIDKDKGYHGIHFFCLNFTSCDLRKKGINNTEIIQKLENQKS